MKRACTKDVHVLDRPRHESTRSTVLSKDVPHFYLIIYPLDDAGVYLVDSGGQYYDGTTDITRTVLLQMTTPYPALGVGSSVCGTI